MPFQRDICLFMSYDGPYLSDTLDITVRSNCRNFLDAAGKPVDLGSDEFVIYRKPCTSFEQDGFGNSNDLSDTGMLITAATGPND